MTKKSESETLHLEALPKAVKRALRVVEHGFEVVECRLSNNAEGEHGKTTLIYKTKGDATSQRSALDAVTKQANIEQDNLLRDDEEDA